MISNLLSSDKRIVLEELGRLIRLETPEPMHDNSIVFRLIRSDDEYVRERAIFLFGIRMKMKEICGDLIGQMKFANELSTPLITVLILSIYSINCKFDLPEIASALQKIGLREEVVEDVGYLYIGFVKLTLGEIERSDFVDYMKRTGIPSDDEINEARIGLSNAVF